MKVKERVRRARKSADNINVSTMIPEAREAVAYKLFKEGHKAPPVCAEIIRVGICRWKTVYKCPICKSDNIRAEDNIDMFFGYCCNCSWKYIEPKVNLPVL